jgi:hypothetical protein
MPGKPCESLGPVRSPPAIAIVLVVLTGVVSFGACGDRQRQNKEPPRDHPARRVIEPSNNPVASLPPYAIRADGVGPYKLGETLSDLLAQLASGPRIALFEIPGVVQLNVVRAEDDAILIGGDQESTASLVAVVGSDVARTESGVHVGSTRDELIAGLGPALEDPGRARDPRLVVPSSSPTLRAVLEGDEVVAIVVASAAPAPRAMSECQRPPSTDSAIGACFSAAGQLIQITGDDIAIRSADGERAVTPPLRVPGLVFAAPLRLTDGRDDLVAVARSMTQSDAEARRSWTLQAYRLEGTRLVRTIETSQLYQLSSANARWIGADLRDVDLYLELTVRGEGIEVGGLLTTRTSSRGAAKVRDVVVISTIPVSYRRGKPPASEASEPPAGGAPHTRATPDAGAAAPASTAAESETPRQ